MFVAREKEMQMINNFLSNGGALLVYGLRRVGKTTLIKKALADNKLDYVYFECQKASEEVNVKLFVDLLVDTIGFPKAVFNSFFSIFDYLKQSYKNHVFVIDEYSYMKQYYLESKKPETKQYADTLDSEFQNIIDQTLISNKLIISGSSIHIMQQLMEYSSPLFGRFNAIIELKQFSYLDAKKMLPGLSSSDVIAFYSVFGGSPYVLERLDTSKSLKENICDLVLNESGTLRNHLKNNVINELESDPDLHDILDVIKNGLKKYSEIENQSHIVTSGLLDKRLKKLLELEIIEAKYPIGKENDKKKKYYQIKDNLLKFYYAFVFRQDNKISLLGENRFYDLNISPSIKEFISRRFENIVKDFFSISIKKGLYHDVVDIGSFFTGDSEFDCVLKKEDDTYSIFEVKYYSKPMKVIEMKKEIGQIKEIKGLNIKEIGFVCTSGFEDKIKGITYLDTEDLFIE